MNALVVTLCAFGVLALAYAVYGRFLARRVFELDPTRRTPAYSKFDGIDYVPAKTPVLFGHHFASIAGLGPILGPAIALIWGWVPAILWVVLGAVFIGAVHDLGALVVSLRHGGRSIGDVCREVISPRARLLALVLVFFLLALAMGSFVLAISDLLVNYNPDAIIPSVGLMFVAMAVGLAVYRYRANLAVATVLGLVAFAGLILWGVERPVLSYWLFFSPEQKELLEQLEKGKNAAPPTAAPAVGEVSARLPNLQWESPYGASQIMRYFSNLDHALHDLEQKDPAQAAEFRKVAGPVLEHWPGFRQALAEAQNAWIVALLFYAFLASVLPVWLLLQPRDYINSFQLYFALATLFLGLLVAALAGASEATIQAAAFRPVVPMEPLRPGQNLGQVAHAPSWFPLLFVTIACGAVSGFHSLVSSGTTVRQLDRETAALPVGYGGMLVEAVLAVLVIMACAAGLGAAAWQPQGEYGSWKGLGGAGLAVQLSAVVRGGANFLAFLGIPFAIASALLAVTIVAFALTTLDTATRLLRFNVEEICRSVGLTPLANRYFASLVAVAAIGFFAFLLSTGGKTLWTLFGTSNQLLAGLTLLTVSVFLYQLGRPIVYTLVPMLVMLGISVYALLLQLTGFVRAGNWPLVVITGGIIGMAMWLVAESVRAFRRSTPHLAGLQTVESIPMGEEAAAVSSR
ncbi:MAG: carbon starvation protein A [Thermoguttaceae bacterium]|nr:carbon starvation protein A [Thermoguttaceae bacterium]MDW8077863.1 carbon starvation protein A [Thermoguttaceae bacterium]